MCRLVCETDLPVLFFLSVRALALANVGNIVSFFLARARARKLTQTTVELSSTCHNRKSNFSFVARAIFFLAIL